MLQDAYGGVCVILSNESVDIYKEKFVFSLSMDGEERSLASFLLLSEMAKTL
jgi:hypothetical protein